MSFHLSSEYCEVFSAMDGIEKIIPPAENGEGEGPRK